MPISDQVPPIATPSRATRAGPLVVALVYDGLCSFEFGCAAEIFGLSRPELGSDWYRFRSCAADRGPLHAMGGLQVTAQAGLGLLAKADTIVIPGWKGIDAQPSPALIRALRAAYRRGARLVSICSGVFVLAAAGLLDDKAATTHWRYAETLARRYPRIRVDPDVLYIDAGQILTSAGSAAGLDLCLHIVRRDYGPKIANHVARRLVIAPHRAGGQAQFIERPVAKHETDARLPALLDALQRQLTSSPSIAQLARRVAMSERTFLRRFRETTGTSPTDWLAAARTQRAKELLESSSLSIDQIAVESGFGTAITLRHHFRRRLGLSPSAYKERFSLAPARD